MKLENCVAMTVFVQGLLKQTEAEHPDYYLLLVCIQQFRSFTAQYHHLLQHNQELLLHNRKEVKRSGSPDNRKITLHTSLRGQTRHIVTVRT